MPESDQYLFYVIKNFSANAQIVDHVVINQKPTTSDTMHINFSNYRFGDKSVCEGVLRFWRTKYPKTKLIAVERLNNTQSLELDSKIHLSHIVDEVIYTEKGSKLVIESSLIIDNLFWKSPTLIKSLGREWEPRLNWVTDEIGLKLLRKYSIPSDFIIFQPLIDAPYNAWRNMNRHHVRKLISALASEFNLVLVGTKETRAEFDNCPGIWVEESLHDLLSLLKLSNGFIGGESGLIFNIGPFNIPTVGIFDIPAWKAMTKAYSYADTAVYSTLPHQHEDHKTYLVSDMEKNTFSVQDVIIKMHEVRTTHGKK